MTLKQHKRADAVKWTVVFILIAVLLAGMIFSIVKITNAEDTREISPLAYKIGKLDDNGEYVEDTSCIVTKDFLNVEGMTSKQEENKKV